MKLLLCLAVVAAFYCTVESKRSPPKVQVYSRNPGEFDKENTLICRVSEFHPPDIAIEILKDGKEMAGAQQTDLSFGKNWHFHLNKYVKFIPKKGEMYTCRVTHGDHKQEYSWEANM